MTEWGDSIRAEYDLPPEMEELLRAAEQAHARWQQIRAALDAEPLVVPGRYEGTSKANPLILAEQRARESFVRAVKSLNLQEVPSQ